MMPKRVLNLQTFSADTYVPTEYKTPGLAGRGFFEALTRITGAAEKPASRGSKIANEGAYIDVSD